MTGNFAEREDDESDSLGRGRIRGLVIDSIPVALRPRMISIVIWPSRFPDVYKLSDMLSGFTRWLARKSMPMGQEAESTTNDARNYTLTIPEEQTIRNDYTGRERLGKGGADSFAGFP